MQTHSLWKTKSFYSAPDLECLGCFARSWLVILQVWGMEFIGIVSANQKAASGAAFIGLFLLFPA